MCACPSNKRVCEENNLSNPNYNPQVTGSGREDDGLDRNNDGDDDFVDVPQKKI